jgi:hypothetical protein
MIDDFDCWTIKIKAFRWHRTVCGWLEEDVDRRSLSMEGRAIRDDEFILDNELKLEDFSVRMTIQNLDPASRFKSKPSLPTLRSWQSGNTSPIGQVAQRSSLLFGDFCVGPRNFEEFWAEAVRPQAQTTLYIEVGPLEESGGRRYTWDVEKNKKKWIYILSASLNIETEPEKKEPNKKVRRFWNF